MVVNFIPSLILSSISIMMSSAFLYLECRKRTISQLQKSGLTITLQVLMILSQGFVIASLTEFMSCQDLYNVNAWTYLDISSMLTLAVTLNLTLLNLQILTVFAPVVTTYNLSEERIRNFRIAIKIFWMICAALHYFYQISWSLLEGGDQFAFLALASNFSAILFGLLVSIYEAIQATIILHHLLTIHEMDQRRQKFHAIYLIGGSLILMILGLCCYGMGLLVTYEVAIPLYSALYFFGALHCVSVQLTVNILVQIFRKGSMERKKIGNNFTSTIQEGGGVHVVGGST